MAREARKVTQFAPRPNGLRICVVNVGGCVVSIEGDHNWHHASEANEAALKLANEIVEKFIDGPVEKELK